MMRSITAVVFLLFAVPALLLGGVDGKSIQPVSSSPDTVGPDAWGYTGVRSNEPGGPAFNWVDITTRGTPVTGLGDDNFVGPFPMQFQFPYYWYTVNRFYVGSNGYINFSAPGNFAAPFAQLPNTTAPNDMLAICVGDLVLSGQTGAGGQVYFWTNGNDSLVVSFIDVTEWEQTINPNSRHTFQVVLNKADSSITYQYGRQEGRYNSTNNTRLCIGMENATGQIGVNYVYSTAPPHALLPDSGIAIRFKRTVNTGLQIIDAGIVGGLNIDNIGKVVNQGAADTIKCVAKNFGTATLSNVRITYQISRALETYRDTVFIASMAPSAEQTIVFPRLFTPTSTGSYTARFDAFVTGDVGPGNNSKTAEIYSAPFAVGQSTRLQFEGGTASGSINWIGGGGMGVMFDSPLYPVQIETVWIQVSSITANPMLVQVLDGSTGAPGTVLAETSITAVVGLNAINLTGRNIRINSGKWFVGGRGQMAFTYETTAPISYRAWEYTGGWGPYRSQDLQDMLIRCSVRPVAGPSGPSTAYAVDLRNQRLVKINIGTGTVTAFGGSTGGRPFYAGDFGGEGVWYAVSTPDTLYSIDTTTGAFTQMGQISGIPAGSNTSGLTWDASTSTMYLCNLSGGVATLYTLNLNTRVATAIGPILTGTVIDIAASNGGQMYGIKFATAAGVSDSLVSINKATGAGTTVGPIGVDVNFAHGLDFDPATDSLFYPGYIGTGVNNLYKINTTTGLATLLFSLAAGEYDAFAIRAAGPAGVTEAGSGIPSGYELTQNYPNPFNPTTTIKFSIPVKEHVTLKIYNMIGQLVATLYDGDLNAGTFETQWNASGLASGVYFYRMHTASFAQTKKLLLLK